MISWLFRPLRYVTQAFLAEDSPRQLALGLALGMVIGLVPKGNLVAICLTVVLFASRVNLGTGMGGAILFSWVGMLCDPLSHRVGQALLRHPALRSWWGLFMDLPLAPWTALNNTVVLGSFILAMARRG